MADKKQSRFDLFIGAVDRFSGAFKGFNDRVARTTANLNRLQSSVKGLGRASGLNRLWGAGQNVSNSFGKVYKEGRNLLGLVGKLTAGFGLLFGAAGGGLFAVAKNTAAAGDEAVKGAQRAGVGIKTWQEYTYAASLADVSNENLQKGLVKLQDVGLKATRGDKGASRLLKSIGIDPKTAKGEIKNADSLFMEVADKIKALQDAGEGGKAVNLAKQIFGKQGAELMPLLLAGKKGLSELRMEAHKLGIVLSEEDGKASEEFNDSFSRMGAAFKGWGYTVGRLVLPAVTKLVTKITDWAAANREVIASKIEKWLAKLDIEKLWQSIENGFATLGRLAKRADDLAQAFGGWGNVVTALAALIGGKFAFSIGQAVFAVAKFGAVLLTTPVGWFLGACAAIAGAVYVIYKKWDDICAYFKGLWAEVTAAFDEGFIQGINKLIENFNPLSILVDAANGLIKYLTGIDMLAIATKWARDLMRGFARLLPDKVRSALGMDGPAFAAGPDIGGNRQMAGKPLPTGQAMRAINNSRTEHVERQENTVKLVPPDGWGLQASGPAQGVRRNGNALQIGIQNAYAGA